MGYLGVLERDVCHLCTFPVPACKRGGPSWAAALLTSSGLWLLNPKRWAKYFMALKSAHERTSKILLLCNRFFPLRSIPI